MRQPRTAVPMNREFRPVCPHPDPPRINARVFKQSGLRHGPIFCGTRYDEQWIKLISACMVSSRCYISVTVRFERKRNPQQQLVTSAKQRRSWLPGQDSNLQHFG